MYNYLALCLAVILFSSCDSDSNGPSAPQGAIMPLVVGNTWVYQVSFLNSDGTTDSSYFDTVKITSATVYNGDSVFLFNHGGPGKLDDQGYWVSPGGPYFNLIAKYPTYTGEVIDLDTLHMTQFPPQDTLVDTMYSTFYCKEFPSMITVPAGTYSAVKYQIDIKGKNSDIELKDIYYFAPGVGKIYWISYRWEFGVGLVPSYKRELVSVDLK